MLITAYYIIQCKEHQKPCNEVGLQSPADYYIAGIRSRDILILGLIYYPTEIDLLFDIYTVTCANTKNYLKTSFWST